MKDEFPDFPTIFINVINSMINVGDLIINCDSCVCMHPINHCIYHSLRIPISETEFITVYVTTRERNFIWDEDGYRPGILMKNLLDNI